MKPIGCVPTTMAMAMDENIVSQEVHVHIQEQIGSCSYAFHFNKVTWHYSDGALTLRGRVSSFHLKQMLQTILRDVTHVQRLVNKVDVVCATGSSSGPKKWPNGM